MEQQQAGPRSRPDQITDAGLAVLAKEGMRGLTHRAVDRVAEVPEGTCSNYFRTREALIKAIADRIFARLTPDESYLEANASAEASPAQWKQLMVDLVDRARAHPELHLALWELRLEASRRPELLASLSTVVNNGFSQDLAFHQRSGLPGGAEEIMMLHFAINGLILHLFTLPDALPVGDVDRMVELLVERIVYGPDSGVAN